LDSGFTPPVDSLRWGRYAGRDVIALWVADMDFPAPPEVIAALRARFDAALERIVYACRR